MKCSRNAKRLERHSFFVLFFNKVWFPQAKSPRAFSCLVLFSLCRKFPYFLSASLMGNSLFKCHSKEKTDTGLIRVYQEPGDGPNVGLISHGLEQVRARFIPVALKLPQLSAAPRLPVRSQSLGTNVLIARQAFVSWLPTSTFASQVKLFWSLSCCSL